MLESSFSSKKREKIFSDRITGFILDTGYSILDKKL